MRSSGSTAVRLSNSNKQWKQIARKCSEFDDTLISWLRSVFLQMSPPQGKIRGVTKSMLAEYLRTPPELSRFTTHLFTRFKSMDVAKGDDKGDDIITWEQYITLLGRTETKAAVSSRIAFWFRAYHNESCDAMIITSLGEFLTDCFFVSVENRIRQDLLDYEQLPSMMQMRAALPKSPDLSRLSTSGSDLSSTCDLDGLEDFEFVASGSEHTSALFENLNLDKAIVLQTDVPEILQPIRAMVKGLCSFLVNTREPPGDVLCERLATCLPNLYRCMETFLKFNFIRQKTDPMFGSASAWLPTSVNMKQSKIYNKGIAWALATASDARIDSLHFICGRHINDSWSTFTRQSYNFRGSTFLVVETLERHLFGAFISTPWQNSGAYFGDHCCMLFELLPNFSVHRAIPYGSKNFVWVSKSSTKPKDKGVGFGGQETKFRLFISADLKTGYSCYDGGTYTEGNLASLETDERAVRQFNIAHVEIWGLDGNRSQVLKTRFKKAQKQYAKRKEAKQM